MKKRSVFLVMLLVLQLMTSLVFAENSGTKIEDLTSTDGPKVTARSAILMDANSGEILYSKAINKKRFPASITKIMTTLVAIENCKSLYDTVTYSDNAINSIEPGSSQIYLEPGERITLEDSLYAIMLESANEACNGVAEHVGGSIQGFVDMMNQKAEEIGCKHTHFMNPNGLHNDDHYVTAYDMALMTKAALANETFRKIASTVSYTIPVTNKCKTQRPMWNHHKMVKRTNYVFDGVEGGKTGFTMMARNTLVTWAKRDNLELIAVVLRDDGVETYADTKKLFEYGYKNYASYRPFSEEEEILTSQVTTQGTQEDPLLATAAFTSNASLCLKGDENYSVLTNKNTKGSAFVKNYTYDEKKKKNLLNLMYQGKKIASLPFKLSFVEN